MVKTEIWKKLFHLTDIIRELHDRRRRERPPLNSTLAELKVMGCVLFKKEGCSVKEIAERLGLSVRTVDKHLELALRELRNHLKDFQFILLLFLLH